MTHIARVRRPSSTSTRSRISCAALFVNVIARISLARAIPVCSRNAIRCVSTRVLPVPAPARMSSGPSPCVTASRWGGLRPASRSAIRSDEAVSGIHLEHRPGAGGNRAGRGMRMRASGMTPATLAQATTGLVCLINAERTKRGIPALRLSFQLRKAAVAHSKDMVAHQFFSHTSRDGATPRKRVQRTGYFRKGKRGQLNETIVLGAGADASPARLAKKLFGHPPHKKIALSRLYRDVGAGLVLGYPLPTSSDTNTTLTVNYGSR